MKRSLYWKLSLAILLAAFTTAGLFAIFIRITSADRLMQFVIDQQRTKLVQALSEYYQTQGSWKDIRQNWGEVERQTLPEEWQHPIGEGENRDPLPPQVRERRGLFSLADASGYVLVSGAPEYPQDFQLDVQRLKEEGTPITVDGQTVGVLLSPQRLINFRPEEARFLSRVNQALVIGGAGALLIALIVGVFLARTLTRPIKDLTLAATRMAQGELEQQVEVRSRDEIGQLAQAFNLMSQQIARANQLRRQMTADIAHDLRTPLTVIGGYIESMRDGVLKPTPQRLDLIYQEIERLQKMVNDLRMLSQADAGELNLHPQPVQPLALLERTAQLFQHHASQVGITLNVDAKDHIASILVDEDRMMQVLDNLISNALRYTPSGGKVTLRARMDGKTVLLQVADTGSGIPAEELPHIFERFHRVDPSRYSESGGSGLGLAIVRALVEAQGGKVSAESELGKGTTIFLEFPALD
ncbi:MAG TPA: hypothetical protein DCE76_11115 [Anaerolineaceae bacterium]|nr:hypothetical protein [Anaerolineaceae bacterium]